MQANIMKKNNIINPLKETSVYVTARGETLKEVIKRLMIHSVSNNQLKVGGILGREKKRRQCSLSPKYRPGKQTGNSLVVILQDKR